MTHFYALAYMMELFYITNIGMPIRRRNYRRQYRRRRYNRSLNRTKRAQYKVVNRVLNKRSELKTRWGFITSGGVPAVRFGFGTATGMFRLFDGINKGTSARDRIGDEIFVRGFRFNLEVVNYDTYNNIRILLVESRGRQLPTDGLQACNEIFKWNAPDNTDAYLHLNSPVNNKYHKIIYDKRMTLYNKPTGQELATFHNTHRRLKISRRWNKKVAYLPAPDTSGTPNVQVTLILLSDSVWGPPLDDHPMITMSTFEAFFNDM